MNARTASWLRRDARTPARNGLLPRLILFLSLLFFALASVIPDSASPIAVGPEGDVAGEILVVGGAGNGEGDGDAVASDFLARSLAASQQLDAAFIVSFESDTPVPRARRADRPFEARGPPPA